MSDTEAIKAKYPQLAYLIDDPEIGPILTQAENEGWSADRFQSAIMATNWWRTTSSSARQYYNLQHTDPATFQHSIWDLKDQIRTIGGQLGYDETVLTEGYLDHFANKALREGLTPAQIQAMIVSEITPLIGTTEKSPILAQLREIQQAYDYVVDTPTLNYWLEAIGTGRQSIDNFRLSVVNQMKSLYPHLANSFDEGQTFDQITRPYRTQIAQLLELDPNTVDFGNPDWRHVVDYVDPKDGIHRSMSNQELSRYVKSKDQYWNTRGGKDEAGEFAEGILQDFGMVKR